MSAPLSGVIIWEATSDQASAMVMIAAGFCTKLAAELGATVCLAPHLSERAQFPDALQHFLDNGKVIAGDAAVPCDAIVADAAIIDNAETSLVPIRVALQARLGDQAANFLQSEYTLAARTGLLDMVGDPERYPLPLPGHQPAFSAGLAAFTGMMAALVRRRIDPEFSDRITVAVEEVLLWLNWKSVLSESWGVDTPTRKGRLTEWPILRCADGWAALVFRDVDWPALKQLIDDPRLGAPCFATRESRSVHRSALFDIVEAKFLQFDRAELTRRSLALRLPIGPVIEPHELGADPQYHSRHVFDSTQSTDGSVVTMPRIPVIWHRPEHAHRTARAAQ